MDDDGTPPVDRSQEKIWRGSGLQCKAKSKTSQERCRRTATPGHLVCKLHGSATPQAIYKRKMEAEEARMRTLLEKMDITPVGDPLNALKLLAGEVVAWKDLMRDQVARLEEMRYSGEYGEQLRAEVLLFERAMDRCASVLAAIARLNIDDRLVAIEESKARMVIEAVGTALANSGLGIADQLKAKGEVARLIRSAG